VEIIRCQFGPRRCDIVLRLKALSKSEDIPDTTILTDLEEIRCHIAEWRALPGTETSNNCFKRRCRVISEAIADLNENIAGGERYTTLDKEKMDLISIQVGRLTLSSENDDDSLAVDMAQIAEYHDRRFKAESEGGCGDVLDSFPAPDLL
jgi:hypothetical protein